MNWEKGSLLYDLFPCDIRSHHLINALQDFNQGKAGKMVRELLAVPKTNSYKSDLVIHVIVSANLP